MKGVNKMNYSRNAVLAKQRALNSKGTKLRKMLTLTFVKAFLICVVAAGILSCCMGIGMFKGILASAPDISAVDVTPTGYATTVYDNEGHAMTKLVAANSNRTYVGIDKIPKNMCNAFVALEDCRFYEHNGIDIKGIMRAGYTAVSTRDLSQGASTITQQLIKNNVFDKWQNRQESNMEKIRRKIQEQYLAMELEKTMSKEKILELYMNTINLGQNTLGVQAASLRYFNKPVYELNLSECSVIASITQNPSALNPISHPEKNKERRDKCLREMRDQGYITEAEYNEALADDVYSRIQTINTEVASSQVYTYFVDEVIEEAIEDLTNKYIAEGLSDAQAKTKAYDMLYSGGLSIFTTQDPQIQSIADSVIQNEDNYPANVKWLLSYQLSVKKADGSMANFSTEMYKAYYKQFNNDFNLLYNSHDDAYAAIAQYQESIMKEGDEIAAENIVLTPQPQISLSIMDQSTGYVLALVGGRGVKETSRSLNRATNTTRQPGSCFKVLAAFAPAIDGGGLTLATAFNDAPYNYANGRPIKNWYGANSYKGVCSIRYGVEQSLNIIAVKTITKITPQLGFQYCQNFGFSTLINRRVEPNGMITSDITQALSLGGVTDGVTNLELTAAYATIANSGVYKEPILYTKIVDHDGNVLIDKVAEQDTHRVLKETSAFLMTDAMRDVVTKGTGTMVNFGTQPIVGKTGTTSDNYDVWFAGYTPYYTCSTWVGYDNNVTMTQDEKNVVKQVWKLVMSEVHQGLEWRDYNRPAGITTATICSKSGMLPVPGLCDATLRTEYFAEGTVPTETCSVHYIGPVCVASNLRAEESCPFKSEGVLELPIIEDPVVAKGSTVKDGEGNIVSTALLTNMCPHNAAFFATPGYKGVLEQQQHDIQALTGQYFDIEGY